MKHAKRQSNVTKRHILLLPVFMVAVVTLIFTVPTASAGHRHHRPEVVELEDAKIIIETNFTDGDAGIQVFLDGEPWKNIQIKDPDGKKIFDVTGKGSLRNFGLTELFSESNEPSFDEDMSLLEILDLFPEGDYEFKGQTVEKDKLTGTATLSHDIPCGPENLLPFEETVDSTLDVVISWDHVTDMLDNATETCAGPAITVETYQVIVENLDTGNEFSIFLEAMPTGNQVTLPTEFVVDGTTYKYEVLAIAENGNQTISETFFCAGTPGDDCSEPED